MSKIIQYLSFCVSFIALKQVRVCAVKHPVRGEEGDAQIRHQKA